MSQQRTHGMQAAVNLANEFLRKSADGAVAERKLVQDLTSRMLMAANCYRGFNYQYWNDQGFQEWNTAGRPDFPEKEGFVYGPSGDQTRVEFN